MEPVLNIKVGQSVTYAPTIYPSNTTYKTDIQWGYQTNGCFTVKTNGFGTYWNQKSSETITGKAPGTGYLTTTIRMFDSKGKFVRSTRLSTKVNVLSKNAVIGPVAKGTSTTVTKPTTTARPTKKTVALKSISLSKRSASLDVGNTIGLSVSYNPTNTTVSKKVTWTSSNSAFASVSNGKVTTKKPGTAVISAKVGGKTATCRITVKAPSGDLLGDVPRISAIVKTPSR